MLLSKLLKRSEVSFEDYLTLQGTNIILQYRCKCKSQPKSRRKHWDIRLPYSCVQANSEVRASRSKSNSTPLSFIPNTRVARDILPLVEKITHTLAREANGNVQITFTIAWALIEKAKKTALETLAKDAEISGFRKGKAPLDLVEKNISQNTIIEKALSTLLPKALADAIVKEKVKPAIYPKFELISAKEKEAWQVRAVTCELPAVELGDYKNIVAGALRAKSLTKEPSKEEKEQIVIDTLVSSVKMEVPHLLIHEEADSRISNLLARIEKLGLSLESYLASVGKTPEILREDYEKQAKEAIVLDLILNKVAEEQKIVVKESDIEGMIAAAKADPNIKGNIDTPEQRNVISSILKRRYALDSLISQV